MRAFVLSVAGISFRVQNPDRDFINEPLFEQYYMPFIETGHKSIESYTPDCTYDVTLRASSSSLEHFKGLRPLFTAEGVYKVYRQGTTYIILYHPEAFTHPLWLCSMDLAARSVDVSVSAQMMKTAPSGAPAMINVFKYPLDQILFVIASARNSTVLVHAAGASLGNHGYIFPGVSGAGKSTITGLLARATNSYEALSDDRVAVHLADGRTPEVSGTPWAGDLKAALNKTVNLKAVFFLSKEQSFSVTQINNGQALKNLLPVCSIPWYCQETSALCLDTLDKLLSGTKAYLLGFGPDRQSAEGLLEFIDKMESR